MYGMTEGHPQIHEILNSGDFNSCDTHGNVSS